MKITEIETIALSDPGKADETLVRVHTDEGITGIGQAESPSLVIDAIIRTDGGLQGLLHGEDPLQVERLWQKDVLRYRFIWTTWRYHCCDWRGRDRTLGYCG